LAANCYDRLKIWNNHYQYQHNNFVHVPIPIIKVSMYGQRFLGKKPVVTEQALNYLTQDSILSIDKARTELDYTAAFNFFSSLEHLDIDP
jgi:hypothetical protein